MGLFKPIGLEISGYNITLDTNIDVFVGDSLKLVFQIKSWDICRSNSANSNVVLTGLIPYLLVENQFGEDSIEAATVFRDTVIFDFSKKYTNFPGKGRLQIRFIDSEGYEIKTPEFEYTVKSSINETLDGPGERIRAYATEDGKLILTEDGKLLIY